MRALKDRVEELEDKTEALEKDVNTLKSFKSFFVGCAFFVGTSLTAIVASVIGALIQR